VSLAPQTGGLARVLSARIPYTLGQWSYSIYLIHDKFSHPAIALQQFLAEYLPFASVVASLIMAGVVIACSAATFICVERPMRRWLQKKVKGVTILQNAEPVPAKHAPLEASPCFEVLVERTGSP